MVMHPPLPSLTRRAFTLLEIIIVVAVLAILLAIAVYLSGTGPKAAATATRTTLSLLQTAMGDFLRVNPEPNAAQWQAALQSFPASAKSLSNLPKANGKIIDGFGFLVDYIPSNTPPTNAPSGFFRSPGPDGIAGNADDIFSNPVAATPP
jgi:prepilin-type N-terminal cleavage/methylation domain-containing protein